MSNRDDDFRFDDDDDLFRSDGDNDSFDGFDDFEDNTDFEDVDFGLDDDVSLDDDEDAEPAPTGPSRTFIIIAAVLILLLLVGVGVVLFSLLGGRRGDALDPTRTAIAQLNQTTEAQLQATDAQATVFFVETATAMSFTATPSPTLTPSLTPTPEVDFTATAQAEAFAAQQQSINATSTALADLATQQSANLGGTAVALAGQGGGGDDATPTPEVDNTLLTPISGSAVEQTATALVALLQPLDNVTPTAQVGIGGALPTPTPIRATGTTGGGIGGALPDTGLFDELGAGGPAVLIASAFGLLGVIAVSRSLRRRRRK